MQEQPATSPAEAEADCIDRKTNLPKKKAKVEIEAEDD